MILAVSMHLLRYLLPSSLHVTQYSKYSSGQNFCPCTVAGVPHGSILLQVSQHAHASNARRTPRSGENARTEVQEQCGSPKSHATRNRPFDLRSVIVVNVPSINVSWFRNCSSASGRCWLMPDYDVTIAPHIAPQYALLLPLPPSLVYLYSHGLAHVA